MNLRSHSERYVTFLWLPIYLCGFVGIYFPLYAIQLFINSNKEG